MNIKQDLNQFKQEYLSHFEVSCSVQDYKGNHCPSQPVYYFEHNDRLVGLCEACFKLYKNGAFDKHKKNIPRNEKLFLK